MKKIWNKKKIVLPLLAGVILLITTLWYVNDYYHTDENVQEYLQTKETVSVTEMSAGLYLDGPGDYAAMIFYPGAKVEYTAYLPLLSDLAEQGIDCFLIKMPCNLAFFGQNKAKRLWILMNMITGISPGILWAGQWRHLMRPGIWRALMVWCFWQHIQRKA